MSIKTNIEILDDCVAGDVSKLRKLVGEDHDRFDKFCKLYRVIIGSNKNVSYIEDENESYFNINCSKEDIIQDGFDTQNNSNGISITETDFGLSINISVI